MSSEFSLNNNNKLFILFSFPCSADHERDWPPCYKLSSFFGLAINTLNVGTDNDILAWQLMIWYSIPVEFPPYILLFTLAPILVWLDGTIFDILVLSSLLTYDSTTVSST